MKPSPTGQYRKKPVFIKAYQWTEFDEDVIHGVRSATVEQMGWPDWLIEAWRAEVVRKAGTGTIVVTLGGPRTVALNDWIIHGVAQELYPCKADIFEQTYEVVV